MTETTAPVITSLDDIVAPGFVADPGAAALRCRGRNHRDHGRPGTCARCGAEVAARDGEGRGYAPVTMIDGYPRYVCWARHECAPDRVAAHRRAVLVDLHRGVLAPRYPARVVKGRKVPVGTTGVITWFGEGTYGLRVGLRDAAGTVHWTAADNVALAVEGELAAQVADRQAEIAADQAAADRLHGDRQMLAAGADVTGWLVELLDDGAPVAPALPIVRLHARDGDAFAVEVGDAEQPAWLFHITYGTMWRLAQR